MPPPLPPLSQAVEQSQASGCQGISQRSSTPSQVRMLRDMFDERPDWWMGDEDLALGSQVHLESFARGLPTGTQSQVDGHLVRASNGSESSRQVNEDEIRDTLDDLPREEHLSSEDDLGTWNVAGNTSMHSDGSSLPADVVDFLATLSQCDMEDIGG